MVWYQRNLVYFFGIIATLFKSVRTDIAQNTELQVESSVAIDEYILCRDCGKEVSDSHYLFSKESPAAHFSFNETLFQKENVLVQIVSNAFSVDLPIITSTKSSCDAIGEWQWDESWYPGYLWKPCICSKCGTPIGWVFEPVQTSLDSPKPFFALMLANVVGETFVDSLIKFPVEIEVKY